MLHSTTTNVLSDAVANIQEYLGAASQATAPACTSEPQLAPPPPKSVGLGLKCVK